MGKRWGGKKRLCLSFERSAKPYFTGVVEMGTPSMFESCLSCVVGNGAGQFDEGDEKIRF